MTLKLEEIILVLFRSTHSVSHEYAGSLAGYGILSSALLALLPYVPNNYCILGVNSSIASLYTGVIGDVSKYRDRLTDIPVLTTYSLIIFT